MDATEFLGLCATHNPVRWYLEVVPGICTDDQFLFGGCGLLYLALVWIQGDRPIGNRPLLFYSAALLGVGTQLVCLGILAELVTSYNIRAEDTYSIAETLEGRKNVSEDS